MYFFRVACAAVLLLGFCSHQVAAAVECLDARGNPVDWYTGTPSHNIVDTFSKICSHISNLKNNMCHEKVTGHAIRKSNVLQVDGH